jgi:hypothetical protein
MSGSCHGDPALGRRKRGERKSRDLHTHGLDEPMGTDSTDAILISEDAGKITGFQLISRVEVVRTNGPIFRLIDIRAFLNCLPAKRSKTSN